MDKWEKHEVWWKRGENFLIEVKHFYTVPYLEFEGRNKWFVYAYIYPKQKKFGEFVSESIYQDATNNMPFHKGCSFCQKHVDTNGNIKSIQVGADYQHYGDDNYSYIENEIDAHAIFKDADELFNYLSKE